MTKWTFSPYNINIWNSSNTRVMLVATEPNGNNPNSGDLDMGDWFRTANHTNNFHNNRLFYNRCKIILDGIFKNENNESFNHFRFVDLKATSGGAQSNEKDIASYINEHFDEVIKFFISKDKEFGLYPHIVVLVGNNTHKVFSKYIQPELVRKKSKIFWVCMPHPSAQTVVNKFLENASCEINQKLKPISERPNKWFCKGKNIYGWKEL